MSQRLIVSKSELERHFSTIEQLLSAHASYSARPQLEVAWQLEPIVAGVVGSGCERVRRNRGPDTFVIPSWQLAGEEIAWLGYREEWLPERATGHGPRFSFRSMSATVHFGPMGIVEKPQIFRTEWSGISSWSGGADSFQADGAGHPHWQFDAIESLMPNQEASEAQEILEALKEVTSPSAPRDFAPAESTLSEVSRTALGMKLSRIHFASAAAWWKARGEDAHAHSPNSIGELSRWLENTLTYVSRELTRLE